MLGCWICGEEIIGQDFAPIVWDLVRVAEAGDCGVCGKGSTKMGFSLLQKEQFSGWRCETR